MKREDVRNAISVRRNAISSFETSGRLYCFLKKYAPREKILLSELNRPQYFQACAHSKSNDEWWCLEALLNEHSLEGCWKRKEKIGSDELINKAI